MIPFEIPMTWKTALGGLTLVGIALFGKEVWVAFSKHVIARVQGWFAGVNSMAANIGRIADGQKELRNDLVQHRNSLQDQLSALQQVLESKMDGQDGILAERIEGIKNSIKAIDTRLDRHNLRGLEQRVVAIGTLSRETSRRVRRLEDSIPAAARARTVKRRKPTAVAS